MKNSRFAEPVVLAGLTGLADDERPIRRMTPKRISEISEIGLVLKARTLGFVVAKPWGDSELYDLVLGWRERFWRVQLKCTRVIRSRAYEIQPIHSVYGKGKEAYGAEEIDALVVHIPPCDAWYVLRVGDFLGSKCLRFYPDIECKAARWEKYREAWHLLQGEAGGEGLSSVSG
ncbi:MAG: group I intron-associated PD-(D/E)XK endonuclease [Terriglobales bacterium]